MSKNLFVVEPSGNEAESGAEELYFNLINAQTKEYVEIDSAIDHGIDPRNAKHREWLHAQLDAYLDTLK